MKRFFITFILMCFYISAFSQVFELSGQIRPRFEYRHGYKKPFVENQDAAAAISQRTRLNLDYASPLFRTYVSIQDITLWGDIVAGSKRDFNSFMISQAWAEIFATKEISLKLGRQNLVYDDKRLFDASDWSQQGRSHDAFLFKFVKNKTKLDVGIAYNQEKDTLTTTVYKLNNYKTLQYAWLHQDLNDFGISFVFVNTGMGTEIDIEGKQNVRYFQTFGPYMNYKYKDLKLSGALYYQTGKNKNNINKSALYGNIAANYDFSPKLSGGLGFQYFTGNSQIETQDKDHEFVPLYGSAHGNNGWMDYFYASEHGKVGLMDIYLPLSFKKEKFSADFQLHQFFATADVSDKQPTPKKMDANLGTEIGIQLNYAFAKDAVLSGGYSQIFATKTLEVLKGGDKNVTQNWAWLQLSFTPSFFKYTKE